MMSKDRLSTAVQITTLLALVIGLLLVLWELRITRDIARVELIAEGSAQNSARIQAMMGEESAASWARACDAPESLTTEDLIILEHLHLEILNNLRSAFAIERIAGDLAVIDWLNRTSNFRRIFGTPYGRWWWQQLKLDSEISVAAEAYLAEHGYPDCQTQRAEYFAFTAAETGSKTGAGMPPGR